MSVVCPDVIHLLPHVYPLLLQSLCSALVTPSRTLVNPPTRRLHASIQVRCDAMRCGQTTMPFDDFRRRRFIHRTGLIVLSAADSKTTSKTRHRRIQ